MDTQALRRQLIYDLALEFYRIRYIHRHEVEWLDEEERREKTSHAYVKARFDAHAGTNSYNRFIHFAEAAIRIQSVFVADLLVPSLFTASDVGDTKKADAYRKVLALLRDLAQD